MEACVSVKRVEVLEGYCLRLTFDDGTVGTVDLRDEVMTQEGVFAPLSDPAYFRQVRVNPELGTIVWPNQADFCPEVLYAMVRGMCLPKG